MREIIDALLYEARKRDKKISEIGI